MLGTIYQKSAAICRDDERYLRLTSPEDIAQFVESEQQQFVRRLADCRLRLRPAAPTDLNPIADHIAKQFGAITVAQVSYYFLYQTVHFGLSFVVEDMAGSMVGYYLGALYDDPAKTLFSTLVCVKPEYTKRRIGSDLLRYAAFEAIKRGSRQRRSIVRPHNYPSVCAGLNHLGYVMDTFSTRFYPHISGPDSHLFVTIQPLTVRGLFNNQIDDAKLAIFIRAGQPNIDYKLIECRDVEGIARLYEQADFKIVAFLRPDALNDQPQFVALPVAALIERGRSSCVEHANGRT